MKPGDYLVTVFPDEHMVGETFGEEWLLHVTILAWFRLKMPAQKLASALEQAYHGVAPFTIELAGETHLGFGGTALVNLVRLPSPLIKLQRRTVALLDDLHADFVTGRGTWGGEYRPHMTAQTSARMHEGDTFTCDRFYLVERVGNRHKIVGVMSLGSTQ